MNSHRFYAPRSGPSGPKPRRDPGILARLDGLPQAVALFIAVGFGFTGCDTFRYNPGNSIEGRTLKYAARTYSAKNQRSADPPPAGMAGAAEAPVDPVVAPYLSCDSFVECRNKAQELNARIAWNREDLVVAFRVELLQLREVASQAIGYNDGDATVRSLRARARQALGDENGAIEDLNVVLRQEPRNVDALLRRSRLEFAQENTAGALADADQALALEPDNRKALLGRSKIRARLQDLLHALADAGRAIALDPGNVDAYVWRAKLNMQRRAKQPALADVDRAIALRSSDASLHALKGNILESFDEPDQARAAYRKACDLGDPYWCTIAAKW